MRIILFGSGGMLGHYVNQYFLQQDMPVLCVNRSDLNLRFDSEVVYHYLTRRIGITRDDVLINCAGIIKQRPYELRDMIAVNSTFPQILGQIKESTLCQAIHITTDCVFSGREGQYTERSLHDCTDEYGKTKSLGEHPSLTTIRTSIIGEELASQYSLIEWVKSKRGETISGYIDHIWNGVTCWELAKIIYKIVSLNGYWTGVRHLFSPNTVSKYELVSTINDIYNLDATIISKKTGTVCDRSLNTIYPYRLYHPTLSIREQIAEQKDLTKL